jgi:hypothetical protein
LKTPSKSRPDYTKFMRKPAPLELSPPAMRDEAPRVLHADIPWAEIIIEEEASLPSAPGRQEIASLPELVPPLPVLMGLAVVVAILIW